MLPYAWRLSLSVARVALGITGLALYVAHASVSWGILPAVAYVAYALFALHRSRSAQGNPLLLSAVDTTAFLAWLIFAEYSNSGWSAAVAVLIYLFLIAFAVLNLSWTRVLALVSLCLIVVFALPGQAPVPIRQIMSWCALLAAVWVVHHRYISARLARASRQSVIYRSEAQHAQETERQRIAADFHDGPLQSFIGLQMRLEIVKKLLERDPRVAAEELRQLQELCVSQVRELRGFVRSMRPADVDGSSLGASISRMVEQFQKDTGVSTSFLSGEYIDPAETEVSLEVLQMVREALNNVQKHSGASRVSVELSKTGESLQISVDDNGEGFPFSGSYSLDELELLRLGPMSIRRRLRALGGDLTVDSRPGQGAGLRMRVPLS